MKFQHPSSSRTILVLCTNDRLALFTAFIKLIRSVQTATLKGTHNSKMQRINKMIRGDAAPLLQGKSERTVQTISQIDTDSDNTIDQIFLQKCPSLMVFNDTHAISCPILGLLGAAQSTPHLPGSAFKDDRNCSHSHFMTSRQNKIRMIPAKILETSTPPHSITSCSKADCQVKP